MCEMSSYKNQSVSDTERGCLSNCFDYDCEHEEIVSYIYENIMNSPAPYDLRCYEKMAASPLHEVEFDQNDPRFCLPIHHGDACTRSGGGTEDNERWIGRCLISICWTKREMFVPQQQQ